MYLRTFSSASMVWRSVCTPKGKAMLLLPTSTPQPARTRRPTLPQELPRIHAKIDLSSRLLPIPRQLQTS